MINILDLRGTQPSEADLLSLVPRNSVDLEAISEIARRHIEDVRARGASALLDQAEEFDRVRPDGVRVPTGEILAAVTALDSAVRDALEESIARVNAASLAQVPEPFVTELGGGVRVRQRWHPVGRVGVYAPGGKAAYPSTVIMNVVPAHVAGVASIALASPPQWEYRGSVHPTILGAAGLLNIDEVYAMGGAGAIGALAYGARDIGLDPVQIVTGPGNVYVAAAKRLVRGVVGIDSEAGPTEIVVIADESADAALVAADLISQGEHDELACAVLVTNSRSFAERVICELENQVSSARHRERITAALTGSQSAAVLVDDLEIAAAFCNAYGPEHLEIQTADPEAMLGLIDNAGAIFVGPASPVSLGDYLAGSNHVLPTAGHARFASGLGAHTFLRAQQIVDCDYAALRDGATHIRTLAECENLPAHGDAVERRRLF